MEIKKSIESGLSLIEVVIFGSIMGVLSLSFSSMVSSNMTTLGQLEDRLSSLKLEREINSLLTDPASCMQTLGTKNSTLNGAALDIRNPDGSVFASRDTSSNSFENLQIDRVLQSNKTITSPNSRGEVTISVDLIRKKHQKIARHIFKSITVDVHVEVDGTQRITNCSTHASLLNQRQVASTSDSSPCSWRGREFSHGSYINGSQIYFDSCVDTYSCVDGVIIPKPLNCHSGRD